MFVEKDTYLCKLIFGTPFMEGLRFDSRECNAFGLKWENIAVKQNGFIVYYLYSLVGTFHQGF